MRGRRDHCHRRARRALRTKASGAGPAGGPSRQPLSQSRAERDAHANAEADSGIDTDSLAHNLSGSRTDAITHGLGLVRAVTASAVCTGRPGASPARLPLQRRRD
jgi:hypothetical protein